MKIKMFFVLVLILFLTTPVGADNTIPPHRIIPITGNGLVSVTKNIENILSMQNGNEVTIPSMNIANVKANVVSETLKTLPASLPNDVTKFVDAVSITIVMSNRSIDKLPKNKSMVVSFAKDDIALDTFYSIAILYWNGSTWAEVETNSLQTITTVPGVYVLILK